ncbi:hypothetical protein BDQ17DRAFT_1297462 [Cyathus striatus]|nr:hypothetical protein BDQ17DRAFT_1297462 [Cyathus striatus]
MPKLDFKTAVAQEEDYLRRVHPTPNDVPGCLNLFDIYLSCGVIRSQVKSLYRYGERPNCSPKLEEFKFCLMLKPMHPEEQREAWIRRRAEWWANKRLAKSSEDVWDIREEPLQSYPRPIVFDRPDSESPPSLG